MIGRYTVVETSVLLVCRFDQKGGRLHNHDLQNHPGVNETNQRQPIRPTDISNWLQYGQPLRFIGVNFANNCQSEQQQPIRTVSTSSSANQNNKALQPIRVFYWTIRNRFFIVTNHVALSVSFYLKSKTASHLPIKMNLYIFI